MPFNGSGVYSAPSLPGSFNPAISGQDATPADWNTLLADLSNALSQTITSNGESTITQDIPMNSHKFTGVSDATARTQFPSMGQIQDGAGVYAADGGTANAMTITLSPALTTYAVGQRFRIKKGSSANTTAVTLNVNGIGAGDVKWPDGSALGANAIPGSAMFDVEVQDISTPTAPVFHLQTVASPPINSGGTVTGTLTMSGAAFNEAVRVDVASATTCDIGAAASNYVRITGTTTITGLGTIASGARRQVVFAAALTLTHNATSLILPTGANITTAAGDCAIFESEGSGNWRCISYQRASGAPVTYGAVTNSLGANVNMVTPGTLYTGPSVAQGTVGTWFASGQITVGSPAGGDNFDAILWDGTTVIDSCRFNTTTVGGGYAAVASLSGYLASPAGNIRIEVRGGSRADNIINYNATGYSKDSTLSAIRIA